MKKVALTICITLGLAACASTGTECTKKTEPKQRKAENILKGVERQW